MKNQTANRGVAELRKFVGLFCLVAASVAMLVALPVPARSSAQSGQTAESAAKKHATLFQYSTLPALSLGMYDGDLSFSQLLQHGDFGLGTLNGLDGEVVILDGRAWQVRADGRVFPIASQSRTPFAAVTFFHADRRYSLSQLYEYSQWKKRLLQLIPNSNMPHAIRIRALFSRIKVRSVPRQQKPYPPLTQVVKTQSEWTWQNVRGTLVGFWFPRYFSDFNLADFHFHFLSDDKKRGGHVLDLQSRDAVVELQSLTSFQMQLPQSREFAAANLNLDQKADLHKAENSSAK